MADESRPKLEKKFEGTVKVRKKSTGRKLAEIFLSEDVPDVKDYLLFDLLVPAIKDTIVNIFTSGMEMLFYGRTSGGKKRTRSGNTVVAYDQFSSSRVNAPRSARRSVYDVMDVTFEDRGKAELVLDQLMEFIDRYQQATVQDFYDACGVTSTYNDVYYGWKDLRGAMVTRARGGWVLNMPEPQQLR